MVSITIFNRNFKTQMIRELEDLDDMELKPEGPFQLNEKVCLIFIYFCKVIINTLYKFNL